MRGLCHDLRTNRRNDGGNGTAFRLSSIMRKAKVLNRLFCCSYLPERIRFRQIIWHISVANSWTLNCTQTKSSRNWKNRWSQCFPSTRFIIQKQKHSLIRKNCMKYSMRWMPESEAGCCTRTNGMPTLDFRRLVYIWQWRRTR